MGVALDVAPQVALAALRPEPVQTASIEFCNILELMSYQCQLLIMILKYSTVHVVFTSFFHGRTLTQLANE